MAKISEYDELVTSSIGSDSHIIIRKNTFNYKVNLLDVLQYGSSITSLDSLLDVSISTITDGHTLIWSGGAWQNQMPSVVTGATGTFTTNDGKTVTVVDGIVTTII